MTPVDDSFLARWSRRKTEARARRGGTDGVEDASTAAEPDGSPGSAPGKPAEPGKRASSAQAGDDASAPRRLNGPPSAAKDVDAIAPKTDADFTDVNFEALDYSSDYSRFMQQGVPDTIRNKALSRLWLSDPMFTAVDPFQDYAGDYTDAAVVPAGGLKTAYRVGRGFLSEEEAAEWDKLGKSPEEQARIAAEVAVDIDAESPVQEDIRAMFAASEAYMGELYPAASNHFVPLETLMQPHVLFLVARRRGHAIGCAALVRAEDTAEIKRMWVDPGARRERVGARLLAALERAAQEDGISLLQLETGVSQPEAIGLYRKAGFVECAPFGSYSPDPLSLFMHKPLKEG